MLIIIIEAKSHSTFISSYSVADSHCLSTLPNLSSFFAPQSHNTASPRNCSTLLLIIFISPIALLSTYLSFPFFSPLLSSFLGLVILTCWLKRKCSDKDQKTAQCFCLQSDTLFQVSLCVRVSCKRWLTLEKAKLPPPFQPPHCLWGLLKG